MEPSTLLVVHTNNCIESSSCCCCGCESDDRGGVNDSGDSIVRINVSPRAPRPSLSLRNSSQYSSKRWGAKENNAAAIAPELDPATARMGKDDEESRNTRATPRWYGSNMPAPLNDTVQNRRAVVEADADILGLLRKPCCQCTGTCPSSLLSQSIVFGNMRVWWSDVSKNRNMFPLNMYIQDCI